MRKITVSFLFTCPFFELLPLVTFLFVTVESNGKHIGQKNYSVRQPANVLQQELVFVEGNGNMEECEKSKPTVILSISINVQSDLYVCKKF